MTLELITGPMFSGKTLELIRRLRLAAAEGDRVRAGKPAIDGDQGWLTSEAGARWPASTLDGFESIERLAPIAGAVPHPYDRPPGCPFHPRCESFMPGKCDRQEPSLRSVGDRHAVSCFLYE